MSLRQKGIEVQFTNFINKYSSYHGLHLYEDLKPSDLVQSVIQKQLFEKAFAVLEELLQSPKMISHQEKKGGEEKIYPVCDSVRRHFRLSKLYVLNVNQSHKSIAISYSYPSQNKKKIMIVNQSFLEKLTDKNNFIKCTDAIKGYFNMEHPQLNCIPLTSSEGKGIQILFYLSQSNYPLESCFRLFTFIFKFADIAPKYPQEASLLPTTSQKNILSPPKNSAEKNWISPQKINLYQRVIASLPTLSGDGEKELNEAAKFFLQIAHFTQVVLCDSRLNKIFGIYSYTQSEYNSLREISKELKENFLEAEKKNLARRFKTTSGKIFLFFFSKPIHPQKKIPDIPFPKYLETLEKILIRRSILISKK